MLWFTNCLYCNNLVYHLSDTMVKCSKCHKKLSLQKINKIMLLIECYINDESALSVSKRTKLSYVSVQKYYVTLRILSAQICENEYENIKGIQCQYEEYHYLSNSKKLKHEAIFDAHNFLTFDYENHIYTILMPSLLQYKNLFLENNVKNGYIDEFKKFKRNSKIIKVNSHHNNIVKFWSYFEKNILKYRGVKSDSFIYFLKECEYKFNHSKYEAIELLVKQYFREHK